MHSSLIAYGHQVPVAVFDARRPPAAGRRLLASLEFPEPWLGHVQASLELIDDLDRRITENREAAAALRPLITATCRCR